MATMGELSIENILAAGQSDDKEGEEDDDEEEEEYEENAELEEEKILPPRCPTFCTTSTNINPFKVGKGDRWKQKEKGEEEGYPVAALGQSEGVCPGVKCSGVRPSVTRLPDLKVGCRGL